MNALDTQNRNTHAMDQNHLNISIRNINKTNLVLSAACPALMRVLIYKRKP